VFLHVCGFLQAFSNTYILLRNVIALKNPSECFSLLLGNFGLVNEHPGTETAAEAAFPALIVAAQ
jgi:hypothetical protein